MTVDENEIDLGPYISALINNWWRIFLIGLLAASFGLIFSLLKPRQYRSTATILLTRSRAELSIANQFPTINEPIDFTSRMSAMLSIANSDAIASQAFEVVKENFPNMRLRDFRKLVEISNQGDLIIVDVITENQQFASVIANTWAKLAVSSINQAYTSDQLPEDIQIQLLPARQEYEDAQTELESFVQRNRAYLIENQISEAQALVDNLTQDRVWQISNLLEHKQTLEQIITQAEA